MQDSTARLLGINPHDAQLWTITLIRRECCGDVPGGSPDCSWDCGAKEFDTVAVGCSAIAVLVTTHPAGTDLTLEGVLAQLPEHARPRIVGVELLGRVNVGAVRGHEFHEVRLYRRSKPLDVETERPFALPGGAFKAAEGAIEPAGVAQVTLSGRPDASGRWSLGFEAYMKRAIADATVGACRTEAVRPEPGTGHDVLEAARAWVVDQLPAEVRLEACRIVENVDGARVVARMSFVRRGSSLA